MADRRGRDRRVLALLAAATVTAMMLLGARSVPRARAAVRGATGVSAFLTTADLKDVLAPQYGLSLKPRSGATRLPTITVNPSRRYQHFIGVGATMTDTSAWLIHDELAPNGSSGLMNELFGPSGLRLNFLRIPIGASDFTATQRPYSYDDRPRGHPDPQLRHFSIAHDVPYVIPVLRQALARDPGMFTMASPWSPPGWMKSNHSLDNFDNQGRLLASARGPLARYLVRFLEAYARRGVHIRALTPQNEPGNPTLYPGMNLNEPDEAGFITRQLVPALHRARLPVQLYGFDWGWSKRSFPFARQLARSPAAAALSGIASHCYYGPPTVMGALHRENPRLQEIESECSPGIVPYSTSELTIASLRNWASAVALWNLAVDPRGGPVQPPNKGCPDCTGLLTIDERTHTFTPTLDLFQLGQVSKFVRPGASRIDSNHFVSYSYHPPGGNVASPGLDDVALRNPDGSVVLLVYNNSTRPIAFSVKDGRRGFSYTLGGRATVTFSWR